MERPKEAIEQIVPKSKLPSGVSDLMRVYERFQEAYSMTEKYLEIISPKTCQSNSNQAFPSQLQPV